MPRSAVVRTIRKPPEPKQPPLFDFHDFLQRLDFILIRIAITLALIDELLKAVIRGIWRTIRSLWL